MSLHYRRCVRDEDFVTFTRFFIRHRAEFNNGFSLSDIVAHILQCIQVSHVVLIEDNTNNVVGYLHYRFVTPENQPDPGGEIVFIDSAILLKEHRTPLSFTEGFHYILRQIAQENNRVKQVQFRAKADNAYLNRLYAKFAHFIGEYEAYNGTENIYSADFATLYQFINNFRRQN